MKRQDEHDPCLEQRVLLEAAIPPVPLAEDRIQATLQVAQRQLQQRRARNRIFAVVGAMTFLATLAAASFWRWDGEDSDAGLTFRASIAITRGEDDYSGTNVQTSAGKIGQDITRMLSRLMDRGALTDDIKAAMLEALDSPAPILVPYQRGVEELRWKLDNGAALTSDDTANLKLAIFAAVEAIRSLGLRDPRHLELANGICRNFRDYVTVVPLERAQSAQPPDHDK